MLRRESTTLTTTNRDCAPSTCTARYTSARLAVEFVALIIEDRAPVTIPVSRYNESAARNGKVCPAWARLTTLSATANNRPLLFAVARRPNDTERASLLAVSAPKSSEVSFTGASWCGAEPLLEAGPKRHPTGVLGKFTVSVSE